MRWCAKVSLKTEFQQMGYAMVIWPVSHLRIAARASALRLAEAAEGRAAGQWHQVEFHQVPRGQGGPGSRPLCAAGETRNAVTGRRGAAVGQVVRARDPDKARALEVWLQAIVEAFGPRILGIDAAVAESWGRISAIRSVPVVDALLAATANVHGLVLVTRNAADVSGLGVPIRNPFEPSRY